jgi:Ca-activated chloride channel family protein
MSFTYPLVLLSILIVLPLFFIIKKSSKNEMLFVPKILKYLRPTGYKNSKSFQEIALLLSLVFAIIALSRPYIPGKEVEVSRSSYELVVGFDISRSMMSRDLYPSRLEFAKEKFFNLLDGIKGARVAILGFSSQSFLIAPLTDDYSSLKFLVKNLDSSYISLKGTSVMNALESANDLYDSSSDKKALLIFSDGGDKGSYQEEIEFANKNSIKVFIYMTATKKGGVIKDENGNILKDSSSNIVVLKANNKIEELALKSDGAYLEYSFNKDDILKLATVIESSFSDDKSSFKTKIVDVVELFYYPLIFALIMLFLALFGSFKRGEF